MTSNKLHVLKFGGTSLNDAACIGRAVNIVKSRLGKVRVAVVVSAIGGVTDDLIGLIDEAGSGNGTGQDSFDRLKNRHLDIVRELTGGEKIDGISDEVQLLFEELKRHLGSIRGLPLNGNGEYRDLILSYGERLSSSIFASALRSRGIQAQSYESQNFIRTNDRFGEAEVDTRITLDLINRQFASVNGTTPVVTGFIGATSDMKITTLGRSGSDYTAGLLGEALKAETVEIWTDVTGVLTADPDIAPTAVTIPYLHYSEIAEMAHFGTKVLHPRTVLPLEMINIPVQIRNTFDPQAAGTLISGNHPKRNGNGRLSSVSVKKDIVLIGLKCRGLDRIERLSVRLLQALSEANITVYFNASASSDYGASVVISTGQLEDAKMVILHNFRKEYEAGLLEKPAFYHDINLVTVIGESLEKDLGLSGAVLSVLGENNIAPLSSARGVANRHLSLVIKDSETGPAVRLINDHFCIHANRLRIFVAGVGTIGGEFIRQTLQLNGQKTDLSVIGICNSKKTCWNPHGITGFSVDKFDGRTEVTDWNKITGKLIEEFPYRTVFVDATGNEEVAKLYDRLLEAGIHIATPSKLALTFGQDYYNRLSRYTDDTNTHFYYETAVGAGLPVLQTLHDLQTSGDEIFNISGVVSGTMTYIFGQLEKGESFGNAIRSALELGYSEPDPRDDLSGEDVARKFMILSRISGYPVERNEIAVESLTPEDLQSLDTAEFLKRVTEYDTLWKEKVDQAAKEGRVLRYTGEMNKGKIKVGVRAVPHDSPLGSLKGSDNQIIIKTRRYNHSPIIIQGPGAGKEVTAAGLLSDVQKIARLIF